MDDPEKGVDVFVIGALAIFHGGFWMLAGYWLGWFIWAP